MIQTLYADLVLNTTSAGCVLEFQTLLHYLMYCIHHSPRFQLRFSYLFRCLVRLSPMIYWPSASCLPHWWFMLRRFVLHPRDPSFSFLIGWSMNHLVCRGSRLRRPPPERPSGLVVAETRTGDAFSALPWGLWLCPVMDCFVVGAENLLFGNDGI